MNAEEGKMIDEIIEQNYSRLIKLEIEKQNEVNLILSKGVISNIAVKKSLLFIGVVSIMLLGIRILQMTHNHSVLVEGIALSLNFIFSFGFSTSIFHILLFHNLTGNKEIKKITYVLVGIVGIGFTLGFSQLLFHYWYRAEQITVLLDVAMLIIIFIHMFIGINKKEKIKDYFAINRKYAYKMHELIDEELKILKNHLYEKNSH